MLWKPPTQIIDPGPCITFRAATSFNLYYNGIEYGRGWNGVMEYSLDGVTWTEWDGSRIRATEGICMLRGYGNTVISGPPIEETDASGRVVRTIYRGFGLSGSQITCSGPIESLLNYLAYAETGGDNLWVCDAYCFAGLFFFAHIITAPTLMQNGMIEMGDHCFYRMFQSSDITEAPALPQVYRRMDGDGYFYQFMFAGTPIASAPKISHCSLAEGSFLGMCMGCQSLVSIPEFHAGLPWHEIPDMAYNSMFSGCSSLKISAVQTGEYQYPFRIPSTGTGTGTLNVTNGMFNLTGGTFTDRPEFNTTYYTDHPLVN